MKKIISVIMIPVLLLCAFSVPAFAAGEEEELPLNSDVGLHLFYGSDDEPALLRIGLGNDFTGFGENVSVELIPTDPEEHASPKKYEKSDMIFAEDQMRFYRKDDEPAIYIKYPDMRSFFAVIGENSLVDSEGNGNSAFRTCEVDACEILADFDYSTNYGSKYGNNYYWKEGRSFIGDSVFISTYVDTDIYINGEFCGNKSAETVNLSMGETTLEISKFDVMLFSRTFNGEYSPSKAEQLGDSLNDGLYETTGGFLRLLISPIFMFIFPLGTFVGVIGFITAPATIFSSIIDGTSDFFETLFSE